ncbi:hypothetical protein EJA72_12320 [Pseudomonas sp. PB120]|uniref:hypothetical protein n=1 Tax=Pseudomonas sp. PB120 TaxID=2494700 RepID=UPI0012FD0B65|nr:hypothetical protein [Pseudomonas sp. PB120]MVV49022.1 hypothetical protein [Pseudomonas sp. PB120]
MRIFIKHRDSLRKFLVLESVDRDGSLILVLRRDGDTTSCNSWSTDPKRQEPQLIHFEKPRPKNKKITIHQSGRVNYHDTGKKIFIEPLTQTTQDFCICRYRAPALSRLDSFTEELGKEDAIFDLSDFGDGPVCFSIVIGPKTLVLPGRLMKLAYEAEGYSINILADETPSVVPAGFEDNFITLTPEQGPFLDQQMAEDQAMISYHQAITGSTDAILYQPNGEGVIRMIFTVPMRTAPQFIIELVDPTLHVSDQDVTRDGRSENVMLKFKVRNKLTGQVIRQPVDVKSIELHAEF